MTVKRMIIPAMAVAIALVAITAAEDSEEKKKDLDQVIEKIWKPESKPQTGPPITIMPARSEDPVVTAYFRPVWIPGVNDGAPTTRPAPKWVGPISEEKAPDNVLFLVDASSSMIGYWKRVQSDLMGYIHQLKDTQRAGLIFFAKGTQLSVKFSAANGEWKAEVLDQIIRTNCRGDTNPDLALTAAVEFIGDKPNSAIYFISDGVFSDLGRSAVDALEQKSPGKNVRIHALLFGDQAWNAVEAMRRIASAGGGRYVNVTGS